MRASIEHFLNRPLDSRTRRILILGDMLELGEWSLQEHTDILRLAARHPDVRVLLVGPEFAQAYASLAEAAPQEAPHHPQMEQPERISLYPSRTELAAALKASPLSDALILIKGSHSTGLEQTIEYL